MSGLNDKDVNINYIINTIGSEQFNSFIKDLEKSGEISQNVLSQIGRLKQKLDEGIIPKSVGMDIRNLVANFENAGAEIIKSAEKIQSSVAAALNKTAQESKIATDRMIADAQRLNEAQEKDAQRVKRKMKRKGFTDTEVDPEKLSEKYKEEYVQGLKDYLSPMEGLSEYTVGKAGEEPPKAKLQPGEGYIKDLQKMRVAKERDIARKKYEEQFNLGGDFWRNVEEEQAYYESAIVNNRKYNAERFGEAFANFQNLPKLDEQNRVEALASQLALQEKTIYGKGEAPRSTLSDIRGVSLDPSFARDFADQLGVAFEQVLGSEQSPVDYRAIKEQEDTQTQSSDRPYETTSKFGKQFNRTWGLFSKFGATLTKDNKTYEKVTKTFADFGKKIGFMGFIASFVIGRISDNINKFARTIFDFGTGLLSTDKATQAMIDNIVNVAMGGGTDVDTWATKAVDGWQKWYDAAKIGQAELGKIAILLMGPFAAAARGVTVGLTKIVNGIKGTLSDPTFIATIQDVFSSISTSIADVVIDLVTKINDNKESLLAFAGFIGEFFKGFYTEIINVAAWLTKTFGKDALKSIGANLGKFFALITMLGTFMSAIGTVANVFAILLGVPGGIIAIGGAFKWLIGAASSFVSGLLGLQAKMVTSTFYSGGVPIMTQTAQATQISSIVSTVISVLPLVIPFALSLIGSSVIGWSANNKENELQIEAAKRGMQRQYEILKGKPTWGPGIDENGNWSLWTEHKNDVQGKIIEKPLGTPLTEKEKIPGAYYPPSNLPNITIPKDNTNEKGVGDHIPTSYQSGLGQVTPLSNWTERGIASGPSVKTMGMTSQTMPQAPPAGIATANFYNTFNIQNFYANGLSDATDLSTTLGNSTLEQIRRAGVSF